LVDSYYKEGDIWKNTILEFYNIFVNNFLKNNKKLNKYRVDAVFATLNEDRELKNFLENKYKDYVFKEIKDINNSIWEKYLK